MSAEAPQTNAGQPAAQGTPNAGATGDGAPKGPDGGRMVYGLDGEEPVNEREWAKQASTPPWGPDPERAVATALQAQMEKPQVQAEDSAYWKTKAVGYQERYEAVAKYEGIIKAMESDSELVSVMQRAISGEMVDEDDRVHRGSAMRDYADDDRREGGAAPDAKSIEQVAKEAEERGRRQAEFQLQLQHVMSEMLQGGASEEEVDKFLEFAKQPSGVTAYDMLSVYKGRVSRSTPKEPQAPAKQKNHLPTPVAAMGGGTDRPSADRYEDTPDDSGAYFPGNPNNY